MAGNILLEIFLFLGEGNIMKVLIVIYWKINYLLLIIEWAVFIAKNTPRAIKSTWEWHKVLKPLSR